MNTTSGKPGWMIPNKQPFTPTEHAAPRQIPRSRMGRDMTTSTVLEMIVSETPPKNPAIRPITIPMATEMPVASRATVIEVRAP